jgi:ADP-ribosylglycohydrolase
MTLFTAEGLIRAWVRARERGICSIKGVLCHAYLRWLLTQGERPASMDEEIGTDGWLFGLKALHSRRAPGNTCLSALRAKTSVRDIAHARNMSKGCGGVMRIAPMGLMAEAIGNQDGFFDLVSNVAAITHGHPSGYLAAGYLAVLIAQLVKGDPLEEALDQAAAVLRRQPDHGETLRAVERARALARLGRPSSEAIESLGGGWVAEEALAIAICAAVAAEDFSDGIVMAVNHSGDSDSTAAITGNILGALWGEGAIATSWITGLELSQEIGTIADDMAAIADGQADSEQMWERYPGW